MDLNNLHFYQIVILILASVMIYQGMSNFFRGKDHQTVLKLSVRLVVWGGMATIALFPNFSNLLANLIGIEGNINAVILTGFILVFLMVFKLLSAIERLEQQVTILNRTDAIDRSQTISKKE